MSDQFNLEKIRNNPEILKRLEFAAQEIISRHDLQFSVEPSFILDDCFNGLLVRLEASIYGQIEPETVKYPKDWVESLKERFFPQWLLKRFPVQYKTHTLQHRVVYPGIACTPNSPKNCKIYHY